MIILVPVFAVVVIVLIVVAAVILVKRRRRSAANSNPNGKQSEMPTNKKGSHTELGLANQNSYHNTSNNNNDNSNNNNNNNNSIKPNTKSIDNNGQLGELTLHDISVGKRLGGGNFSDVYQGIYRDDNSNL